MTFEEVAEILDAGNQYSWAHDAARGVFVYKPDLNLRIVRCAKGGPDSTQASAKSRSDSNAATVVFEVFYGASFVTEVVLVAIDDQRVAMPMPRAGTSAIPGQLYRFAKIVDTSGKLDECLAQHGFEVAH